MKKLNRPLTRTFGALGFAAWLITPGTLFAVPAADAEDSPLYASSRQGAFATMAERDRNGWSSGIVRQAVGAGTVIVVEGTRWHSGPPSKGAVMAGGLRSGPQSGSPRPLNLTYEPTCAGATMLCASCMATRCGGGATCTITCLDPRPTCLVATCDGSASCSGPTCTPPPTCYIATCAGDSTCQNPTCYGTCVPVDCRTSLLDVRVPQAGQFQLSFNSSAQLKYVLQFCTNLSAGSWSEACATNGTGGLVTLCHTNGAAVSLYKLLIQQP